MQPPPLFIATQGCPQAPAHSPAGAQSLQPRHSHSGCLPTPNAERQSGPGLARQDLASSMQDGSSQVSNLCSQWDLWCDAVHYLQQRVTNSKAPLTLSIQLGLYLTGLDVQPTTCLSSMGSQAGISELASAALPPALAARLAHMKQVAAGTRSSLARPAGVGCLAAVQPTPAVGRPSAAAAAAAARADDMDPDAKGRQVAAGAAAVPWTDRDLEAAPRQKLPQQSSPAHAHERPSSSTRLDDGTCAAAAPAALDASGAHGDRAGTARPSLLHDTPELKHAKVCHCCGAPSRHRI